MGTVEYVLRFVVETSVRFAPLFFLSIALAAIVKALPIAAVASRWLARREHASIAAGSLLGTFSPFCSCTVVPVVRSLLVAGAPLAGVMAFWVASPLMDPEIFVLSVGLLGWDIAVARVVAALALSLAAGLGVVVAVRRGWLTDDGVQDRSAAMSQRTSAEASAVGVEVPVLVGAGRSPSSVLPVLEAPAAITDGCCGADEPSSTGCGAADAGCGTTDEASCGSTGGSSCEAPDLDGGRRGVIGTLRGLDWGKVRQDFLGESWHIGRWIVLAFALEALILLYVPQEALIAVLGQDAPWAVPLAALLGVPLYMDSFSALPVISGLLEQGMAPGAAIAFLLAGPVTTIPAMTSVRAVLPGPVFRYYLAVSLFGSMGLGLVANAVL